MKAFFPLAALLLTSSAPLLADETPAQKPEEAKKKEDINHKIVCHDDPAIGTRVRKNRVCMTVAQWRDLNDEAGDQTERNETRTGLRGGGG